jgi:hypothetical protein
VEVRAASILHGLGFNKEMQRKKTREFSGGAQRGALPASGVRGARWRRLAAFRGLAWMQWCGRGGRRELVRCCQRCAAAVRPRRLAHAHRARPRALHRPHHALAGRCARVAARCAVVRPSEACAVQRSTERVRTTAAARGHAAVGHGAETLSCLPLRSGGPAEPTNHLVRVGALGLQHCEGPPAACS